ncbi:unnamed protein product, partial [Closterium sp. NIES-53]
AGSFLEPSPLGPPLTSAMAQSDMLHVARPWQASVSARRAPRLHLGSCPLRAPGAQRFFPMRPPAARHFLPVARPGHASVSARRTPRARNAAAAATPPPLSRLRLLLWCMWVAGVAHDGFLPVARPAIARAAPTPPPPPPFLLHPPAARAALEVAGLKGFANGTVPIPTVDDVGLRGEFRAAHLLTFMVISRCCSPVVQPALRSYRERLDAGHQAWHFILSTYQVRDDLYIGQLEEKMTQGQRRKPGGGGSGGGRSTKDVDKKRSTWDKGRGGGGQRRECWICHDPNHLSYVCPDRDDSDKDDTKGGRGRSTSRRRRRDVKPCKEKQTSKKTSLRKDVDNSSGKSRGSREASCSMVGVVEPTVSLAQEAGEDFQAVAAAVQANPMAVLLDSGCSHHLIGTKAVFIDMAPSDDMKHVRGFNGALQPVEGRGTVALQGEVGKRVLIPYMLYAPDV